MDFGRDRSECPVKRGLYSAVWSQAVDQRDAVTMR